ncbi:MAG TPA: hypothetical protein VIT92_15845, partial [Burkholderiaceae bacterium]
REQRHQHVGAGRIADQRGDNRDVGAFLHSLRIPEVLMSVNVAVSKMAMTALCQIDLPGRFACR